MIRWSIISRNERSVTVNGRHYFACRCDTRKVSKWKIWETNQAKINGSKVIRTVAVGLSTREVTKWLEEQQK